MGKYCGQTKKEQQECQRGAVCDFCFHFVVFRNKEGRIIDGSGYCGLHRKEIDIADCCDDYICQEYKLYREFIKEK